MGGRKAPLFLCHNILTKHKISEHQPQTFFKLSSSKKLSHFL